MRLIIKREGEAPYFVKDESEKGETFQVDATGDNDSREVFVIQPHEHEKRVDFFFKTAHVMKVSADGVVTSVGHFHENNIEPIIVRDKKDDPATTPGMAKQNLSIPAEHVDQLPKNEGDSK